MSSINELALCTIGSVWFHLSFSFLDKCSAACARAFRVTWFNSKSLLEVCFKLTWSRWKCFICFTLSSLQQLCEACLHYHPHTADVGLRLRDAGLLKATYQFLWKPEASWLVAQPICSCLGLAFCLVVSSDGILPAHIGSTETVPKFSPPRAAADGRTGRTDWLTVSLALYQCKCNLIGMVCKELESYI